MDLFVLVEGKPQSAAAQQRFIRWKSETVGNPRRFTPLRVPSAVVRPERMISFPDHHSRSCIRCGCPSRWSSAPELATRVSIIWQGGPESCGRRSRLWMGSGYPRPGVDACRNRWALGFRQTHNGLSYTNRQPSLRLDFSYQRMSLPATARGVTTGNQHSTVLAWIAVTPRARRVDRRNANNEDQWISTRGDGLSAFWCCCPRWLPPRAPPREFNSSTRVRAEELQVRRRSSS